ncbi:MAG: OB-fold domain-containing protein [Solirubrobacterales bacterium]|nr:OB-fold domain-containing protein [Solirubrobacterales bacterium]
MEPSPAAVVAEHAAHGRLAFQRDREGRAVWPPRVGGFTWAVSAGRGAVYASTTARPRGEEPYDVSLIDLDEGFRIMSRVVGAPVAIGTRVRAVWQDGLVLFEADPDRSAEVAGPSPR